MGPLDVAPVEGEIDQEGATAEMEQEEAKELAREAEEAVVVPRRRLPEEPTPEERVAHEALHEPYRNWCRACVAGRGRADAHRVRESRSVPVIGIDFGYLVPRAPAAGEAATEQEEHEDHPGACPLLAGRCGSDRWLLGTLLQQKGVTQYGREFLQKELKNVGMQRVVVRSDGEPAIVALKRAAGNAYILER